MRAPGSTAAWTRRARVAVVVAFLLGLVAWPAPPVVDAGSTTFTVTSFADETDGDPGDGKCNNKGLSTKCSLRAALVEANALSGTHTIVLAPGTYTLDRLICTSIIACNNLKPGEFGPLVISRSLTIKTSSGVATIKAGADWQTRLMTINGSVTVSLENLVLQGGDTTINTTLNPVATAGGGCLRVTSATVTLKTTTIKNCKAPEGGGAFVSGGSSIITLANNSEISDNVATGRGGGAVVVSRLTLDGSGRVRRNTAGTDGGGIANIAGILTITGSSLVTDNVANPATGLSRGGGIFSTGIMTMTGGTIAANTAARGGGLFNTASASLTNAHVDANHAASPVVGTDVGGGIANTGTITIQRSQVTRNLADVGGGLHNGNVATISNSTLSNNSTNQTGGGIENAKTLTLNNVTLAFNAATTTGGGLRNGGAAPSTTVSNSIFGQNSAAQGKDCFAPTTARLIGAGFNLIQAPTDCNFTGNVSGNITNQDPKFEPHVGFFGGRLQAGSPAIDRGNSATPTGANGTCATVDQNGLTRPIDGDGNTQARCDMGATEFDPGPNVGVVALSPALVTASTGEWVRLDLTWTVPDPLVWRDLATVDVRLQNATRTPLWVRFDQNANTLALVDPATAAPGPGQTPGAPVTLATADAFVDVGQSTVTGSGPAGQSVTLSLLVQFRPHVARQTFDAQAQATTDNGGAQPFGQAGVVQVELPRRREQTIGLTPVGGSTVGGSVFLRDLPDSNQTLVELDVTGLAATRVQGARLVPGTCAAPAGGPAWALKNLTANSLGNASLTATVPAAGLVGGAYAVVVYSLSLADPAAPGAPLACGDLAR